MTKIAHIAFIKQVQKKTILTKDVQVKFPVHSYTIFKYLLQIQQI